jgi:hypothetical protein
MHIGYSGWVIRGPHRGKAKDCLLSLPNGSINSWDNLREAFINKYYPLLKFCKIEIAYFLLSKMIMNM